MLYLNVNVTKSERNISKGLGNSDFESGLAVISVVIKSGKINTAKACKNFGPKKPRCYIRNVVKSGDEKAVVHCTMFLVACYVTL